MSIPLSATVTHPLGAFSRIEGGKTQEAMDPYPRPDRPADARGFVPWKKTRKKTRSARLIGVEADARGLVLRKKTRSALIGVEADARGLTLRKKTRSALIGVEADARGLVLRKKTRSADPRDPRVGRGRPTRQNRAGFLGITGYAEGSMLRLVFYGQDIGQAIAFARYAPICLLSKRLPNKPLENNALAPGHGPTRESTPVRRAARAIPKVMNREEEKETIGLQNGKSVPSFPSPTP